MAGRVFVEFVCWWALFGCAFASATASDACMSDETPRDVADATQFIQLPNKGPTASRQQQQQQQHQQHQQHQKKKKPNVVLFVMDDVGWSDVSYHTNGGNFPTPTIDRLSSDDGMRLERFYTQPQCTPTRATVLSGRYSWKIGLQHYSTIIPGSNAGMPDGVTTIAEHFRQNGYQTHAIGKWHVGEGTRQQTPTGKGFDVFVGCLGGRSEFYNRTMGSCGDPCLFPANTDVESPYGDSGAGLDIWKSTSSDEWISLPPSNSPPSGPEDYVEDLYEKTALQVFQDAASPKAKPFFMYFTPQLIHEPLEQAPRAYPQCTSVLPAVPVEGVEPLNRTALCTMMARLDEHFLAMETKLKDLGLWEDTLIFAFSDNGGMIMYSNEFPASTSCNWPLRGGKTSLFEGGIRVPAFVTGGALPQEARASENHDFIFATDVFPTLATFAGLPPPPSTDGVDQWGTITGQKQKSTISREVLINTAVNPMGGFPDSLPGFTPDEAPTDSLNFSSIIVWPHKLIFAEAFIALLSGEPFPRSGYYTCDGSGYVYHEQQTGSGEFPLDIPNDSTQYPRTHGRTLKAWLFNIEQDPGETDNLLLAGGGADIPKALEMVARIEYHTQGAQGWVPPQPNLPNQLANPACYDWTWLPGPWSVAACAKNRLQQSLPDWKALARMAVQQVNPDWEEMAKVARMAGLMF